MFPYNHGCSRQQPKGSVSINSQISPLFLSPTTIAPEVKDNFLPEVRLRVDEPIKRHGGNENQQRQQQTSHVSTLLFHVDETRDAPSESQPSRLN